jgi:predicted ATPase
MRLLHYIEIENFKTFDGTHRIELDHPTVLIGPNNSGKTSTIQALALWSFAVKSWFDVKKSSDTSKKHGTALNRLNITAVPVQKTKFFWNKIKLRADKQPVPMRITVGIEWEGTVVPIGMSFSHNNDELVYCRPHDDIVKNIDLIEYVASINIHLLYPMSGLVTEEPVLKSGRIEVLLGQGETAGVLRNLCLMVYKASEKDWLEIVKLMRRLFSVELKEPFENARGSIELYYTEDGIKDSLDISMSGRGFQQVLLIVVYLFSHKGSVLLIDEPDAHLEILRQKQIYTLLRNVASSSGSQAVIVTHSEIILDEAIDNNLTLVMNGVVDDIAAKKNIRNTLKHFGAEHYIKAKERHYVLYVEGSTDIDMLKRFAEVLSHPVIDIWDERLNVYYVQDNYPLQSQESDLARVEGGYGIKPQEHFGILCDMVPGLKGLAILDNDGKNRSSGQFGELEVEYWKRYEAENYFISPPLLRTFAQKHLNDLSDEEGLFATNYDQEIDDVLDELILTEIFSGDHNAYKTYYKLDTAAAMLIWDAKTERLKLSRFTEKFFIMLSKKLQKPILLRKGEFHQLINMEFNNSASNEIIEKLDKLHLLFQSIEG